MELESIDVGGKETLSLNYDKHNKTYPYYVALFREDETAVFVHEHVEKDDAYEELTKWRHLARIGGYNKSTSYKKATGMTKLVAKKRVLEEVD